MTIRIENGPLQPTIIRHPGIAFFEPEGPETHNGGEIELGAVRFFEHTLKFYDTPSDPITLYVHKNPSAEHFLTEAVLVIGTRKTRDRMRIWARTREIVFPGDQHAIDQYVFASPIRSDEQDIVIASTTMLGSWNVLVAEMQPPDGGEITYGYQMPFETVIEVNEEGRIHMIPSYWYREYYQALRRSMGRPSLMDGDE